MILSRRQPQAKANGKQPEPLAPDRGKSSRADLSSPATRRQKNDQGTAVIRGELHLSAAICGEL